ncbi:MAG TPA: helix-turn-helix transcriptional regulator [Candidatus Limnocylindrales bacterium]|jgi:transcriptional regulator with XRE-family HTH domain|nr:helix-turn-helix transcriptional regulator [Candidatus Limnocylindrales bacterium]
MDRVRFGLLVRMLRRRRGWTQEDLAHRTGLSQSVVSRLERGGGYRLPVETLERVAIAVGARLRLQLVADGENLDRLLDADHAALVEHVSAMLARLGWEVAPEVTFSVYGERGSIDILGFHPPSGALLVIEVKSVIPDVQATLAGLDRKHRLAADIARKRGWRVRSVSRWLVVADTSTARDRVGRHGRTFDAALPLRTVALRRWATSPAGPVAGILFVRLSRSVGRTHRIRHRSAHSVPGQSPRG